MKLVFRAVLNHGERSIRTSEAARLRRLAVDSSGSCTSCSSSASGKFRAVVATNSWRECSSSPSTLPGLDQAAFATCLTERTTLQHVQATDAEQRTRGIVRQPIFEISGPGGSQRLGRPAVRRGALGGD